MQFGLQLLYADATFNKNGNTTTTGGNGGNAIGALPGASLFVTVPLGEKFTAGFGTFSYFGLAENYDNDWAGRYYVQNATLAGVSLMPSLSFKATDWLSLGAGLNAMYGLMDTKMAVNRGPLEDGSMKLKDEVWGFGGNFGILVSPTEKTRVGVTYLSPVCLDFEDKPNFNNVPLLQNPPNLKLGITVPQSVMVGIFHELKRQVGGHGRRGLAGLERFRQGGCHRGIKRRRWLRCQSHDTQPQI